VLGKLRVFVVGIFAFETLFKSPNALTEGMAQFWEPAVTEKKNDKGQNNEVSHAQAKHESFLA
jgi:hypothetical protein